MSTDQSQMFIAGRIASDFKEKTFGENSRVVEFRIATNHSFKDRDGQWKDGDTSFFQVQCWDRLGTNVLPTLRKGMPVIVYGRLLQSTWTVQEGPEAGTVRSMLRLRASHVGPDLNQREARVCADQHRRLQEEEQKKAEAQAQAEQEEQSQPKDSYFVGSAKGQSGTANTQGYGNSSASAQPGGRELPVDDSAFAGAVAGH